MAAARIARMGEKRPACGPKPVQQGRDTPATVSRLYGAKNGLSGEGVDFLLQADRPNGTGGFPS